MEPVSTQKAGQYRTYERVAITLYAALFAVGLLRGGLHWNTLYDLAYLTAGILLVRSTAADSAKGASWHRHMPLILCAYLFVDSVLGAATLLHNFNYFLIYAVLSALFGAALLLRLSEQGLPLSSFHWDRLSRSSALLPAAGASVSLLCMFLPMLPRFDGFVTRTPDMVFYMTNSVVMFAGKPVRYGSTYMVPGWAVPLGHLVCLLLAGTAILALLRSEDLIAPERALGLSRVAALASMLWWLYPGKGYQALGYLWNQVFLAGCALLLFAVFLPRKAGTESLPSH